MTHPDPQAVCALVSLKPGSLEKVRAWAEYLAANRAQALESLATEGVSIESVFLHTSVDGDFLVYYMRSPSIAQAQEVAQRSSAAIDQYHAAFKRDTWKQVSRLELLVDLQQGRP